MTKGDILENYRIHKVYKITADVFRKGFAAYQKKFVYPKSYLLMAVFFILALNFVYGAVNAPDNYFAYIMIVLCLALMIREWFNPRKLRRVMTDAVRELEQEYKFVLADDYVEFSTIQREYVENFPENQGDNIPEENDSDDSTKLSTIQRENVENSHENQGGNVSEENSNDDSTELSTIQRGDVENSQDFENVPPSKITLDNLQILEYDDFFLFLNGKIMFYIVPKSVFSDSELNIIRNISTGGK